MPHVWQPSTSSIPCRRQQAGVIYRIGNDDVTLQEVRQPYHHPKNISTSMIVADFDFEGRTQVGELTFRAGNRIRLLEASPEAEWWQGQLLDEQGEVKSEGFFPRTHGHLSTDSPYDGLRNKQRVAKRNVVLAALLRSERDYIKFTTTFIDSFVNPLLLLDTPFKRKLLADSSLSLLLHLLVEINAASSQLFNGITSSTSGESLAQTYRQFATTLPLYAQYITEIPQGLNALKKHSDKVVSYISKMDLPLPLSAEDYLLEPLEHYTRYRADLQEFVWLTPPNAPELGAFESSLLLLTDMLGQVTDRAEEADASIKLLELQSQFLGQQQIFSQTRRLVKAGELDKIRDTGGNITSKRYYCHLFNDALVYSVVVPAVGGTGAAALPTFKLHKWIPLASASVRAASKFAAEVSNSFTLTSARDMGSSSQRGEKVDVFRCCLPDETAAWVLAIEKLLRNATSTVVEKSKKGRNHLPGVNFGELGPRAACAYTFLDREADFAQAMSKINRALVQPLLRAAGGKPLSFGRSQGLSAFSSSALGTKTQQAIAADVQSADVQLFLHAAEALAAGLQELQQALQGACQASRWAEAALLGGLFSSPRSRNLYAHFKSYSSKQLQFLRILHRPHFLSFYREVDAALANIAGSSLAERLDLPRRHPSSYLAFLQSLLLLTPSTHADHVPLLESAALLSDLLASIDEKLQARQNFEKVLDVQSSLFSSSIFGADDPIIEQLASPGRTFVKEGDLRKVCKHKNKLYRFWMFNDLLIYGSSLGGESFAFHFALQLARCSVAAVPSDARALEIVGPGKAFMAIAPSKEARDDWVDKITAAKTALVGSSANGAAGGAGESSADDSVSTISVVTGADKCGICATSFSLFRRRHSCSRCSKAVCGEHSKKAEGQRVCLGCLTVVEPKFFPVPTAAAAVPPPSAKPIEAAPATPVPITPTARTTGPGRRAPPPPVMQVAAPTTRPISYRRASIVIAGSEAPDAEPEQGPFAHSPPSSPESSPLDADVPVASSLAGDPPAPPAPPFKPPPPPPRPPLPSITNPLTSELMTSIQRLQLEPMELRKARSRFSMTPPLGGKTMMLALITRLNSNRSKLEGSDDDSGSDSDSDFD